MERPSAGALRLAPAGIGLAALALVVAFALWRAGREPTPPVAPTAGDDAPAVETSDELPPSRSAVVDGAPASRPPGAISWRIVTPSGEPAFSEPISIRGVLEVAVVARPSPPRVTRRDDIGPPIADVQTTRWGAGQAPVAGWLRFHGQQPRRAWAEVVLGTSVLAQREIHPATEEVVLVLTAEEVEGELCAVSARFVRSSPDDDRPLTAQLSYPRDGRISGGVGLSTEPTGEISMDGLTAGRYVLDVRLAGATILTRDVELRPGPNDLGDLYAMSIVGIARARDGTPGSYHSVLLGRYLPEHDVVSWSGGEVDRVGSDGRFRFAGLPPGRYVLRCDPVGGELSAANLPTYGSKGVWVSLETSDARVVLDLFPTVEVSVPARGDAKTRSLRIIDGSGHALRSEWVQPHPSSLRLVPGTYEVEWWDDERPLGRHGFTVSESTVTLPACP